MKIKILLAAAVLLILSGCKNNIDESGFINGTESSADTEFSLTTFNTNTDTKTETTVPKESETENLSVYESENTSLAEASQTTSTSTSAETTAKTTAVTSETEIISLAPNETTAEKTTTTGTTAAKNDTDIGLNNSANICLSKLSFGMSAEEAAEAMDAEIGSRAGNIEFYSNVSLDLDESFCEAYITYRDGICQIVMNTSFMPEDKALELEKSLIKKLNKIYRLSDKDWAVGGMGNDICLVNETITLELTVNKSGKNALVALSITSPKHMGDNNTEDISVFPPN